MDFCEAALWKMRWCARSKRKIAFFLQGHIAVIFVHFLCCMVVGQCTSNASYLSKFFAARLVVSLYVFDNCRWKPSKYMSIAKRKYFAVWQESLLLMRAGKTFYIVDALGNTSLIESKNTENLSRSMRIRMERNPIRKIKGRFRVIVKHCAYLGKGGNFCLEEWLDLISSREKWASDVDFCTEARVLTGENPLGPNSSFCRNQSNFTQEWGEIKRILGTLK